MKLTLVPFAILRELLPESALEQEVPEGTTATQLMHLLAQAHPEAEGILRVTRLAHEDEYMGRKTLLQDGAEYCLIPPVSGGRGQ